MMSCLGRLISHDKHHEEVYIYRWGWDPIVTENAAPQVLLISMESNVTWALQL